MLFVGAGLSFLSKGKNGDSLPDGASLVDLLLDQPLGTGSMHPLDRVAGHIVRTKGVDFVYDLLKSKLTVVSVDPRLARLYDLPWRRVYTTNYDDAVEASLRTKRPVSSLTIDGEVAKARPGSILHLNGYIGDVSPATLQSGLVLTDYSYAASRLLNSEWFKFFLRDLRSARAIIFAGYSLADLDIQRALIADTSISRKTFFFISPAADELERGALADYGQLVSGGIDALVSSINRVSSDYEGVRFASAFLALTEISVKDVEVVSTTNAQKLMDQLVYGRLPEADVLHSETVFGDQPYLVFRKQDREAAEALKSGPWRDLLYVGELASGKTASALNMTAHLLSQGYRVFYVTKGTTLIEELHTIASIKEKIALVFENYASLMDEIREYVSRRHPLHRVILTERAVSHELVSGFIDRTPHLGPTFFVGLDCIDKADVRQFEALVNFGGFWGERAGASERACTAAIDREST